MKYSHLTVNNYDPAQYDPAQRNTIGNVCQNQAVSCQYVNDITNILTQYYSGLLIGFILASFWHDHPIFICSCAVSVEMQGQGLMCRCMLVCEVTQEKDGSYTMDLCDYWRIFDRNNHLVTDG